MHEGGPSQTHPTVETDPHKAMLERLISAPRSVQPILMDVVKRSHVTLEHGELVTVVHYHDVEQAVLKARARVIRDVTIGLCILAAAFASTLIIVWR